MPALFASIFPPTPASISMLLVPRTSSGRSPSEMRFRSSAGARRSHSGFGTTPNMAPPSRRNQPSESVISSRSPNFTPVPRAVSSLASLLQLDQDAMRRPRVDERDQRPVRARPRRLVDEPHAAGLELRQRGDEIVDPQGDVMQAGPAFGDELGDR